MKRKYDLKKVTKLAESRGGKFLSTTNRIVLKNNYEWECSEGHKFSKRLEDVDAGQWCRDCSTGLYERICRGFFESIFEVRFPNVRNLEWLKNNDDNYLELDGYNKELGIAFEHQGSQHYGEHNYFEQPKYDELKKELCSKNNVKLICIPELYTRIKIKNLLGFLKKEFKKNKILFNEDLSFSDIDLKKAYAPKWLDELKVQASNRNLILLSKVYIGHNEQYEFKCKKRKHTFSRTKYDLDECPKCRYEVKVLGKYYENIEKAAVRNKVSYDSVTRRIRLYGETADEGIRTLKKTTKFFINGEKFIRQTKEEICKHFNIKIKSVDQLARRKDLSFEESCESFINKKLINVNGKSYKTFSAAANYYNLNIEHLYLLRSEGLSEEAAINQVLNNRNKNEIQFKNNIYKSLRDACKQLGISYSAVTKQMNRKNISNIDAIDILIKKKNKLTNLDNN